METLLLTQFLSMSLGIIMAAEGLFDGSLAMGWLGITSALLQNSDKSPMAKEPDYGFIGDMPGECDAG